MTKNYIAFVIVSAAILAGWLVVQNQLFPPSPIKKAETEPKQTEKKSADEKKVDVKKDEDKKDEVKKEEARKVEAKKDEPKKDELKKEGTKTAESKIAEAKEPEAPSAKEETHTLGDSTSFLQFDVTSRGAAVRRLTLTRFEAADYLGNRVPGRKLELIQDDPVTPSFRMYHFEDPSGASPPILGLGERVWNLEEPLSHKEGGWKIAYSTTVPGKPHVKIVKTYTLQPGDYHIGMTLAVSNNGSEETPLRYQLTGATGLPVEGEWYTSPQYTRSTVVGIVDGRDNLARTMEDSTRISHKLGGEKVPAGNNWIQYAGVMNQYFASAIVVDPKQPDGDWKKLRLLDWARPTLESTEVRAKLLKIGEDKVTFLDGEQLIVARLLPRARQHLEELGLREGQLCVVSYYRTPEKSEPVATWFRKGQSPRGFFDDITIRVNSDVLKLTPGRTVAHRYLLYHGPVKTKLLGQFSGDDLVAPELVDRYTHQLNLRTLTDYHSDTSIGWFFSQIGWTALLIACTNIMHWLLHWLQVVVFGNYGLAIILLTVVVRGSLYPISRKQALMSQKMQELTPELKKIQEKFKSDPQAKAQATFELYRKHKVNPVGSGCLPLVLQMPIFLGLYYALQESIHFRLARFLWIDNLAAPDMLFWWGEWSVPILDWFTNPDNLGGMLYLGPYFNLLPLIAVAMMLVQQKLLTPPPQNEEQEVQQKTMQIMMGVMGVFFYKVASGLCLYFIASSLWGVAERKLLPKKRPPGPELAPVAGPASGKPTPSARDRRRDRDREKQEEPTAVGRLKEWWQKLLESAEKK